MSLDAVAGITKARVIRCGNWWCHLFSGVVVNSAAEIFRLSLECHEKLSPPDNVTRGGPPPSSDATVWMPISYCSRMGIEPKPNW